MRWRIGSTFSERKIIMGKFEQSGFLNWGQAVDGDGTPLWKSSASPWQRVEATGRIHKMRPAKAKAKAIANEASERAGLT